MRKDEGLQRSDVGCEGRVGGWGGGGGGGGGGVQEKELRDKMTGLELIL